MAKHIDGDNISDVWVKAMEYLLLHNGKSPNLIASINPCGVGQEVKEVRLIFDSFLKMYESPRVRRIDKVADTLFPKDFYFGGPGDEARRHVYEMQRLASKMERRYIKRGTYFDRLMDWPGGTGNESEEKRNQLERNITRLRERFQGNTSTRNHNNYELSVSIADTAESVDSEESYIIESGSIRVQDAIMDPYRAVMGFPCLSHISLTLFNGRLDMTAVYRNQHFITKAYGNYVGLSNLQKFIVAEVGCEMGELVCVATHADAEIGGDGITKSELSSLVRQCRTALNKSKEQL